MSSFETTEARVIRMLGTRMYRSKDGWPRDMEPVDAYIDELTKDRTKAISSVLRNVDSPHAANRYFAGRLAEFLCNPIEENETKQAESMLRAICGKVAHEGDERVLTQYVSAIGNGTTSFSFVIPRLLELSRSDLFNVRLAATQELNLALLDDVYDEDVVERLIKLSSDEELEIRNWATFALGTSYMSGDDVSHEDPAICEALVKRLKDPYLEARDEAIDGLAARGDERGIAALQKRLRMVTVTNLNVRSAGTYGNPLFYEDLVRVATKYPANEYDHWAQLRCNPDPNIRASAPVLMYLQMQLLGSSE